MTHIGTWLFVSTVVSWLFYRYFAPTSWKEWRGIGVVQAFIVAFYAEMYGFPLTLYFLARFSRLDVSPSTGDNFWAQLFGTPVAHVVAMVLGYSIAFSGASLVAGGWHQVHRAAREGRLVTDGIYARMRHPQYTGLFLIVFGEGIVHWPTLTSVIAFPVIVIVYARLARKEEREMVERFGDHYREYQRHVPMFVPRVDLGRRWREA